MKQLISHWKRPTRRLFSVPMFWSSLPLLASPRPPEFWPTYGTPSKWLTYVCLSLLGAAA